MENKQTVNELDLLANLVFERSQKTHPATPSFIQSFIQSFVATLIGSVVQFSCRRRSQRLIRLFSTQSEIRFNLRFYAI